LGIKYTFSVEHHQVHHTQTIVFFTIVLNTLSNHTQCREEKVLVDLSLDAKLPQDVYCSCL